MIPTFQKISRVYNTHVMPTRTKWRTPHTINYCPYSLQLTHWTLFYLLGRACPKHPCYGPSNELRLLVHSLNLFCVFFFSIVCTYMLMPTGSLQLLLLLILLNVFSHSRWHCLNLLLFLIISFFNCIYIYCIFLAVVSVFMIYL